MTGAEYHRCTHTLSPRWPRRAGLRGRAASFLLRLEGDTWDPEPLASDLSLVGAGIAVATAWMEGELVERLGVAVHAGAHLNARSSLPSRPRFRPAEWGSGDAGPPR